MFWVKKKPVMQDVGESKVATDVAAKKAKKEASHLAKLLEANGFTLKIALAAGGYERMKDD